MRSLPKPVLAFLVAMSFLATSVVALAQAQGNTYPSSPGPSPGWHSFSNPPDPQANSPQPNNPPANDPPANYYPPSQTVPSQLRLPAGTFLTVRVDQELSSDKNQAGDGFSATLTRPLVADGVVVVQRGQILGGRVIEAQKAGRVKGVSRLTVQLTDLTLVDGQQVPIESSLDHMTGPTSKARDAGAIAGTTLAGAAIGGAADLGPGAVIGAGAGLIAGTVGVLLTRGRPSVIYPESLLTFRLAEAVTISTDRAPQAFHYVDTNESNRPAVAQGAPPTGWTCKGYGFPPPYPPPPPPYYYYPYYPWGASVALWWGPGFFYGRGYYGRGFGYRR